MSLLFQVPSAAGPSTRVGTDNTPEVPSSEDVIRLLRMQLKEKSQRVRNLEAELEVSQSQVQTSNDREEFLLAEIAAQVHDLNCKFIPYMHNHICFTCTLFTRNYSSRVSKATQPRKIALSKTNSIN